MNSVILTVHQLNEYVRILLVRDPMLQNVRVRGEISNFKLHSSGHMYFTLKDEQDRIQCVLFKQRNQALSFIPENGMRVIAKGMVSLYTRDGQYQLYVDEMERDGLGDLYLKFEALKKKLREEGLFDAVYKKPLPLLPSKIAVITSHTGAAVRDIIRVTRQRNKNVDLLILPVAVQGQAAPEQIAKAIDYANTRDDIDLIITGRGGGSIEELWAFNEEIVAWAIFRSEIPVISAVGHETDFTIADFVADLRAATPSNAAELAVPETSYMLSVVEGMKKNLADSMIGYLTDKRHQLERLKNHYVFQTPRLLLDQQNQYLDHLNQRLVNAVKTGVDRKIDNISRLASSLQALSPLNVLARGYAIAVPKGQTTPVRSISQLSPDQQLSIRFADGRAVCSVEEINPLDNDNII
ncbi:MAG TPA: exodeoxyribonuclease VII large subunit [Clostridiales bacterium]|nr:exodeoxyribonuclease VII large subunit [Clostridiales bacterium]